MKPKLIKLDSLENETSETIVTYCINTLNNKIISIQKLIAYSANNTNTNFGGRDRHGTNNVYFKLQSKLSKGIEDIGCPAHNLRNAASTSADVLSIDVESIALKIYKYFSIYTVRNERLKFFCDDAVVVYANLQWHSRTRWLSLLPAIERILKLWEPLKDFFLAESKPPKMLVDFFQHPLSQVYFLFLHSQSFLFEKHIKKIEKSIITIIEVKILIDTLERELSERAQGKFLGIQTKHEYNKLKSNAQHAYWIKSFDEEIANYYKTAIEYLKQWSQPLSKFNVFSWMTLNEVHEWQNVKKTILYLQEEDITITDNCFQEIIYLKHFIEKQTDNEDWQKRNAR